MTVSSIEARPMMDAAMRRWLPWVVALAFFMQTLDTTILNTALPGMARALGENPLRMQSTVMRLASSPPSCPPIPSATTINLPCKLLNSRGEWSGSRLV